MCTVILFSLKAKEVESVSTTQVMVNVNADTENTFVAVLNTLRDEDRSVAPRGHPRADTSFH